MAEEEKIVLTLNNEAPKEEVKEEAKEPVTEEQVKQAVSDVEQVTYEALSDGEKKMVDDFAKQIDLSQTLTIIQYGSPAQTKVADFSDSVLNNIKTKDAGEETSKLLTSLIRELKMGEDDDAKGLAKLFKSAKTRAKEIKDRYDSVSSNVEEIAKVLEDHQVTLMKDINILDQLYEKNLVNYKELSMYIIAGYKALEEYKTKDLVEAQEKAAKTNLPEDAQKVKDIADSINRFEKRLHDLELTRVVAIQMAPQIRLVQNNDTTMIEKIQSTLVNTIPLWKSQILITMGIEHSTQAVKAQNEVTEMTNKMLRENAENLKMATINTAKESEKGIVEIETLKETNQKLIETLDEVKRIQDEGKAKRAEALVELRKIESELQTKLTNVTKEAKNI